jgi:hypothetical protein
MPFNCRPPFVAGGTPVAFPVVEALNDAGTTPESAGAAGVPIGSHEPAAKGLLGTTGGTAAAGVPEFARIVGTAVRGGAAFW